MKHINKEDFVNGEPKDVRIFELGQDESTTRVVKQTYGDPSAFTDSLLNQLIVQHSDFVVKEFSDSEGGGWFSITDTVEFPHSLYTVAFQTQATKYESLVQWIQEHPTLSGIVCVNVEMKAEEVETTSHFLRRRKSDIQRRVDLLA